MKEFDFDAYIRKWRNCVGFFVGKSGELQQTHIGDFDAETIPGDKTHIIVRIGTNGNNTRWVSLDADHPTKETIELKYVPVESGWYGVSPNLFAMLVKRHAKHFSVGISNASHMLHKVVNSNGVKSRAEINYHNIDFLNHIVYTGYDPGAKFGILSRKVWFDKDQLYFLATPIGIRKESKLILENESYVPYIKTLVGDKCAISSL